jgi:uncharacterized protein YlxP (DUF503 family)
VASGYVGVLTFELHFPGAHSLKEKRHHLRSAKAQLQNRVGAAVAEVDHHDLWQRAGLTLALVSRTAGEADERLSGASRMLHADAAFQVVGESRDLVAVADDDTISWKL